MTLRKKKQTTIILNFGKAFSRTIRLFGFYGVLLAIDLCESVKPVDEIGGHFKQKARKTVFPLVTVMNDLSF